MFYVIFFFMKHLTVTLSFFSLKNVLQVIVDFPGEREKNIFPLCLQNPVGLLKK